MADGLRRPYGYAAVDPYPQAQSAPALGGYAAISPYQPAQPPAPAPASIPSVSDLDQEAARQRSVQQAAANQQFSKDSPFLSGLESGYEGLKGSAHGIAGLAKGAFGDTAGERDSLRAMQANQATQAQLDSSNDDFSKAHGLGGAFGWAEHKLGEAIPGVAATVVPALLTDGASALASAGLRRLAASGAEKLAGDEAASLAGGALRSKVAQELGGAAGGTLVSGEAAAGTVNPNASDADLQTQSQKALAGAAGLGAIQSIPGLTVLRRWGAGEAAAKALDKALPSLGARVVKEAAVQGGIGAAVGGATAVANRALHNWVTGNGLTKDLVSHDALIDYMNAAGNGAFIGAALGAGGAEAHALLRLPALGNRAKLWRISQKLNDVEARARPKPGEPINPDGSAKVSPDETPVASSGVPGIEVNEIDPEEITLSSDPKDTFDSKLAELQKARSQWETDTFGDLRGYDTHDNGDAVTVGTQGAPPTAKLFNPDWYKAIWNNKNQFDLSKGGQGKLEAAILSLLKGDALKATPVIDGAKAAAKAFRDGFDGLSKGEQNSVGDYLNALTPEQRLPMKRMLLTMDALDAASRQRVDLAGNHEGAPVEGTGEVQTANEGQSDTGLEGRLSEQENTGPDLNRISDEDWRSAQFGGKGSRPSPIDENVLLNTPNQDGSVGRVSLSMKRAASALQATPEGRDFMQTLPGNRNVKAVLGVVSEALNRGSKIDPNTIRPGLRVFPGDGGRLTPVEAKAIRAQLVKTPTEHGAPEPPTYAQSLRTARAEAAQRGEATGGPLEPPSTPERELGQGDFDEPGTQDAVLGPRKFREKGVGEDVLSGSKGNEIDRGFGPDQAVFERAAAHLGIKAPRPKRAIEDDGASQRGRILNIVKQAKELPPSKARTALLGAVQRMADGDERLSDALGDLLQGKKPLASQHVEESAEPDYSVSLDRPADAGQTVRESVAEAMRSPLYKKVFQFIRKVAKTPTPKVEDLQRMADDLSKAFGVAPVKIRLEDGGFVVGKNTKNPKSLGYGMYAQVGDHKVVLLNKSLRAHEIVSVFTHEFGHHLMAEKYVDLPADHPVRQAIEGDFQQWVASREMSDRMRSIGASRAPYFNRMLLARWMRDEGGMTHGELRAKAATDADAKAKYDYMLSFNEYFADMTARALQGNAKTRGIIGKYFASIAHAMKLVHNFIGKGRPDEVEAPQSFKDFVANTLTSDAPYAPEVANAKRYTVEASDPAAPNDGGIGGDHPPPDRGGGPGTPGDRPSDITMTLNPRDRGIIESLVTRRDTFKKILTEFPQLRDDLLSYETQMETATNAAYALYKAGRLDISDLGEGALGAMRKWDQNLRNVFGAKSGAQLGQRIFNELKNDAYNGRVGVRTKERTEAANAISQRLQSAKSEDRSTDAAALQGRLALRRSINYALHTNETVLRPFVDKFLRNIDDRMRSTNSPALRKLVSMMHQQTGEGPGANNESMMQEQHRKMNEWFNRYDMIKGKLDRKDEIKLTRALQTGKTLTGDLEVKRQAIRKLLDEVGSYTRAAGSKHGEIKNFYPIVMDPARVRKREAEFRSILSDPDLLPGMRAYFGGQFKRFGDKDADAKAAGMSHQDMVDAFFKMASHEPEHMDGLGYTRDNGAVPSGSSFRPRVMKFLGDSGRQDLVDRMSRFQTGSLDRTMLPYLRTAAKRAAFFRRAVDAKGNNKIDALLDEAKKGGATDKEMTLARQYVDAQLGNLGSDPNPVIRKVLTGVDKVIGTKLGADDSKTWEKVSNALVTYQNVRVLGLGLLSNMIDPLGVWTRSSSLHTAYDGYRAALRSLGKDPAGLRAQAEALGIVERHALSESMSWAFGNSGNPGTASYRINQMLFRLNGMALVTRFARLAALAGGHKFLLEHAAGSSPHSARYLSELGLTKADIKPDAQRPGFVDVSNEKVQKALYRFVDESVVRPVASQRPVWHADPNFKIASQYRGFIFSFYSTIMKRMAHEVKNGNIGAVAPMIGYLGVTMAAEAARELVQYGPDGNPSHAGWGFFDHLANSVNRSGMLGPRADFMNSSVEELRFSHVPLPYESLSGPTVSQVDDVADMMLGKKGAWNTTVEAVPGESIFGNWVKPAKRPSHSHQGASTFAASFADDFVLE